MVANGNNSLTNQCDRTTNNSPTGIDSSNIKRFCLLLPYRLVYPQFINAYTGNLGGYMTHQMYKLVLHLPGTFYKSNVKQTSWWPS